MASYQPGSQRRFIAKFNGAVISFSDTNALHAYAAWLSLALTGIREAIRWRRGFAFQGGYGTIELAGAQEKQAVILGFHGYATKAEAEAKSDSVQYLSGWPVESA